MKRAAAAIKAKVDEPWPEAPPQAVHALATRFALSACDAAYLWLAADLKAVLATFDRKLGNAAKRHLGAAG